jgi:hypothetical protein
MVSKNVLAVSSNGHGGSGTLQTLDLSLSAC